jgi:hypothetical protein
MALCQRILGHRLKQRFPNVFAAKVMDKTEIVEAIPQHIA